MFDWLTHLQASPLTYLAVFGAWAWPRFAAADAVGATLWAAYATGLGYLGEQTFERRPLFAFLFGLGVAVLVVLIVEVARRLRRHGARAGGRVQSEGGLAHEARQLRCSVFVS